jgi:hypothetical protein
MTTCCPKCASNDARRIERIYTELKTPDREHSPVSSELSRQSAPPSRRHPIFWVALACVLSVAAIAGAASRGSTTAALILCAALAVWMARDADRYNHVDLPRLLDYWHHAFICVRCGEVYVSA